MSSRFTKVMLTAALVAPLFAGIAIAQPSGGPGPNAASSSPNTPNSLPLGGSTGQEMPNDGRIVLQPQMQTTAPAPMMRTDRQMTRRQRARARHRAHRASMRSSTVAPSSSMSDAPTAGPGANSSAAPR